MLGMRAEDLEQVQEEFDVITSLWNVLGHVEARATVMEQFCRLLAKGGCLFLDVNHRYNALEYGFLHTAGRFLMDRVSSDVGRGDVVAKWEVEGKILATRGHVFRDEEIRLLARRSGLEIRERMIINYSNGRIERWPFQGNLLYMLRRADVT